MSIILFILTTLERILMKQLSYATHTHIRWKVITIDWIVCSIVSKVVICVTREKYAILLCVYLVLYVMYSSLILLVVIVFAKLNSLCVTFPILMLILRSTQNSSGISNMPRKGTWKRLGRETRRKRGELLRLLHKKRKRWSSDWECNSRQPTLLSIKKCFW